MESISKIKIKMGAIEVEYEGSQSFLKEELPELLKAVSNLYKEAGGKIETETAHKARHSSSGFEGTTATIAAKLGCSSAKELVVAAAVRLTFVLNQEKFSRKELSTEMKSASSYYKATYLGNLTSVLRSLIEDQTLLEPTKGVYAIKASEKENLKSRLA